MATVCELSVCVKDCYDFLFLLNACYFMEMCTSNIPKGVCEVFM